MGLLDHDILPRDEQAADACMRMCPQADLAPPNRERGRWPDDAAAAAGGRRGGRHRGDECDISAGHGARPVDCAEHGGRAPLPRHHACRHRHRQGGKHAAVPINLDRMYWLLSIYQVFNEFISDVVKCSWPLPSCSWHGKYCKPKHASPVHCLMGISRT